MLKLYDLCSKKSQSFLSKYLRSGEFTSDQILVFLRRGAVVTRLSENNIKRTFTLDEDRVLPNVLQGSDIISMRNINQEEFTNLENFYIDVLSLARGNSVYYGVVYNDEDATFLIYNADDVTYLRALYKSTVTTRAINAGDYIFTYLSNRLTEDRRVLKGFTKTGEYISLSAGEYELLSK